MRQHERKKLLQNCCHILWVYVHWNWRRWNVCLLLKLSFSPWVDCRLVLSHSHSAFYCQRFSFFFSSNWSNVIEMIINYVLPVCNGFRHKHTPLLPFVLVESTILGQSGKKQTLRQQQSFKLNSFMRSCQPLFFFRCLQVCGFGFFLAFVAFTSSLCCSVIRRVSVCNHNAITRL